MSTQDFAKKINAHRKGASFPTSNLLASSNTFALLSGRQMREMQNPAPDAYFPAKKPYGRGGGRGVMGQAKRELFQTNACAAPSPQQYRQRSLFGAGLIARLRKSPYSEIPASPEVKQPAKSSSAYYPARTPQKRPMTVNASDRVFTYWAPSMTPGPLGYNIQAYQSITGSKIVRETFEEKKQKLLTEREQQRAQRKWRAYQCTNARCHRASADGAPSESK